MRIPHLAVLCLIGVAAMPAEASAQQYFMRAKIEGLKANDAPAKEYKGVWFNTGQQETGVCNNGSRRVDWIYACRFNGYVSNTNEECDPAKKPNTFSNNESCSSTCGPLNRSGSVGPTSSSQTVSGTLAEMKSLAKAFCERANVRPDLQRACVLTVDPDDPGRGRMIIASDFNLAVTPDASSWWSACTPG